jgi:hypothetical protein
MVKRLNIIYSIYFIYFSMPVNASDSKFFANDTLNKVKKLFESHLEINTGLSTNYRGSTGIRFINGYYLNDKNFIGIGIGGLIHHTVYQRRRIDNYKSYPLFVRYSRHINSVQKLPYLFTDVGVNLDPDRHKYLKPVFFRIGSGKKFVLEKQVLYFSLAYSYNRKRDYYSRWNGGLNYSYSDWYDAHTCEISLGLLFK